MTASCRRCAEPAGPDGSYGCTAEGKASVSDTFYWMAATSDDAPVFGYFGHIGGGGYSVVVDDVDVFRRLQGHWINLNTRMTVVEFTVYNRNEDLFTSAKAMIEISSSGMIVPTVRFSTHKFIYYGADNAALYEIVFVIAVGLYVALELQHLARDSSWDKEFRDLAPSLWYPRFVNEKPTEIKNNKVLLFMISLMLDMFVCV